MGVSTDFVGHIDIEPPLNDAEVAFMLAFAASRRYDRADPYDVPGNPLAETSEGLDPDRYNRPPPGQPHLWCDWQVCWDGCCITWSGKEKSYSMEPWLRYVIDHFLKTGAEASGDTRFSGFTFDHVLNGTLVGCRRDNKELFAIRATDNVVTRTVLTRADPRYIDLAAAGVRRGDRQGSGGHTSSPPPAATRRDCQGGAACPARSMIKV